MTVAIHQPNFMPWMGIFHRISMVDTFVFFDHIQAMNGKSWFSRNKILLNNEAKWFTMPIYKSGRSFQKILDAEINYEIKFVRKHFGTLKQAYGKTKYYNEIIEFIEALYKEEYKYLADFNKIFIKRLSERLGIKVKFVSSNDILKQNKEIEKLAQNDLVLGICKALNADKYISGTGCLEFINPNSFKENGIIFEFQQFTHPSYNQVKNKKFVSHLSIIDALFNCGFNETKKMIIGENYG